VGIPEDGKNDDKWITVTGNGKTQNLLNPKPYPKCIMHLLFSPNPTPPLTTTTSAGHNKSTTTKPSYPQAHKSAAGREKLPGASTSNEHCSSYANVTICFLTTVSPKPNNASAWQSIPPMHNATSQLSGLPNTAQIWQPLGFSVQSNHQKI
jgi:hypothetical protein